VFGLLRSSNFDTVVDCEVEEGMEMVGGRNEHQEVVRSTVEVAMVIMASIGTPTGDSRSRSTGKLIFDDRVSWVPRTEKVEEFYSSKEAKGFCPPRIHIGFRSWGKS